MHESPSVMSFLRNSCWVFKNVEVFMSVCESAWGCITFCRFAPHGAVCTNGSLWLRVNNSMSCHIFVEPSLFMVGIGTNRRPLLIFRSSRYKVRAESTFMSHYPRSSAASYSPRFCGRPLLY